MNEANLTIALAEAEGELENWVAGGFSHGDTVNIWDPEPGNRVERTLNADAAQIRYLIAKVEGIRVILEKKPS